MKLSSISTAVIATVSIGVSVVAGAFLMLSPSPGSENRFGTVHFPISCPTVQEKFDHAVGLVHNFFYPETVKAFQAIIAEDPDCAMAYWGLAISQRPNPLVVPFPAAAETSCAAPSDTRMRLTQCHPPAANTGPHSASPAPGS